MLSVARGEDRRHSHRKVTSTCYATSPAWRLAQHSATHSRTTVLLGAYLLAAVAARVPSSKSHIPLISTLRISFHFGRGCPTQSNHQADNLAKLWQEFLSVIELIAKIFGAVSRTTSLMRLSALLASKRCRCRNDGFCSDEEQGNTPSEQNQTYQLYVILKRWGVDAVICHQLSTYPKRTV